MVLYCMNTTGFLAEISVVTSHNLMTPYTHPSLNRTSRHILIVHNTNRGGQEMGLNIVMPL